MPFVAEPIALSEEEKTELEQMTQSRTLPAGDVMKARMVLLLAKGTSYQQIQKLLDTTAPTISRWKTRFMQHRLAGLIEERHPGQKLSVRTPRLQARVLAAIKEGPQRWIDSLVVPETGCPSQGQQRHHSTHSVASRCSSTSVGTLHGQQ